MDCDNLTINVFARKAIVHVRFRWNQFDLIMFSAFPSLKPVSFEPKALIVLAGDICAKKHRLGKTEDAMFAI